LKFFEEIRGFLDGRGLRVLKNHGGQVSTFNNIIVKS